MSITSLDFTPVHVTANSGVIGNEPAIRIVKKDKLMQFDENTYLKLNNISFHNGVIQVKVLSRILTGAPNFSRGFIGLAFRINNDDSAFESFYIRPANGHSNNTTRKQRTFQYFAYPNFTFEYFHKNNISEFEGSADIDLEEWITLKVLVQDKRARFFINETPVLTVDNLKLGSSRGSVGLFVDLGTEGFFKDLEVTLAD